MTGSSTSAKDLIEKLAKLEQLEKAVIDYRNAEIDNDYAHNEDVIEARARLDTLLGW